MGPQFPAVRPPPKPPFTASSKKKSESSESNSQYEAPVTGSTRRSVGKMPGRCGRALEEQGLQSGSQKNGPIRDVVDSGQGSKIRPTQQTVT